MAIAVHIVGSDGNLTKHVAKLGDVISVGADQRVILPDAVSQDVDIAINSGDTLTLSIDGQTLLLSGLLTNMENETGAALAFGDGTIVDSLGALLDRASLLDTQSTNYESDVGMADLVREDADGGDLLYLESLAAEMAITPPQTGGSDVLELGELVDVASDAGSLLDYADTPDANTPTGDLTDDLWASTEFGGETPDYSSHHHDDSDIINLLLTADDGIS